MKRLAAALAVAGALAAPAAAHAHTVTTARPVVLVSGAEAGAAGCQAQWGPFIARVLRVRIDIAGKPSRFTGGFDTVSGDHDSRGCETTLPSALGIADQARGFASWLVTEHPGETVDVVAAGTSGVVVRYALAMSGRNEPGWPRLPIEDVVTVGTPHAGAAGLAAKCPRAQACHQLDKAEGTTFLATLAGPDFANPQGSDGGTDWTAIGSASDELVTPDSALALDASHKTIYAKPELTHAQLLTDDAAEHNATINYSHRGGQTTRWMRAPHLVDRVANDLVFGARPIVQGSGCTGSSDQPGGAGLVDDPGLVSWQGPATLSYIRSGALEAYSACFKKLADGRLASDTVVRLNGLDVTPGDGSRIEIDPKTRRVTAGRMSMAIPSQWFDKLPIPLRQDAELDWTLPKAGGTLSQSDFDGFGGGGSAKIAGLAVKGSHKLTVQQGAMVLELNLALPGIFSGTVPTDGPVDAQCDDRVDNDNDGKIDYPDDKDCKSLRDNYESAADGAGFLVSVKADNVNGLIIDKIGGTVEGNLRLGKLQIGGGASLSYSRVDNEWSASLTAVIPIPRAPSVKVAGSIKDGSLKSISAEVDNLGVPLGSVLYLQKVKLGLVFQPGFEVSIGTALSVGPRVHGEAASEWIGDLTVNASSLKLTAKLLILGSEWGNGSLEVKWAGSATAEATLNKDLEYKLDAANKVKLSLSGTASGTVDSTGLDASGKAGVCFEGSVKIGPISGSVSSTCLAQGTERVSVKSGAIGVSACGQLDLGVKTWAVGIGARHVFAGGVDDWSGDIFTGTCDVDAWHAPGAGAAQAGGAPGVTLASGLEGEVIGVQGRGVPPHVALAGPGGARVPAPASATGIVRGDGYAIVHSPANATTYVLVAKPDAGRWTVQPQPDSAPVTDVRSADTLPQPEVRATVSGHTLTYDVKRIPGQVVRFREVGRDVVHLLGTARSRHGRLRFRPAFGRGGVRRIVAEVEQRGYPRATLDVARYVAPKPGLPRAPKRIALRRRGERLAIGWSPVAGASGYAVGVWTGDGRELGYRVQPGAPRRVVVRNLLGRRPSRVMVRALRPDGAVGRAKTVRG